MKKSGMHYCVCQFFFVSLQPICTRMRVFAMCACAYLIVDKANIITSKIKWKNNKKSMMDRVFKCSRD